MRAMGGVAAPCTTCLIGKALSALLPDRIEEDLHVLHLFNTILEQGERAYGADFVRRINEFVGAERGRSYRIVPALVVRPSQDLGEIAARCLSGRRSRGLRDWLSHNVVRYLGRGIPIEADLLSYLFVDGCYTERLIDLGRRDAEHAADAIARFLSDPIPGPIHVGRG